MCEATYALAQLSCNTEFLSHVMHNNHFSTSASGDTPLDPWLSRLVAIAAGLDPSVCVFKNTYSIGIMHILSLAVLYSPNLVILSYLIEEYLPRLMAIGFARENACSPLRIYSALLKRMRKEMVENDRRVFMITSQFDQMAEKSLLFRERDSYDLVVHGRSADGIAFNECVTAPV